VTIGQIYPATGADLTLTEAGQGLAAAVKYYNAHGGINGHEIKLVQCDTKDDPNVEAQCAQTLVTDGAVADVGGDANFNPAAVQSTLAAANIPRIGLLQGSVEEYQAKTNYDVTTGSILLLGGMVVQIIKHGCKKVSMITVDSATAGQLPALITPFATAAGGQMVNFIEVPGTTTDYTPYLTEAEANGACGAAFALGTTQADALAAVFNQIKPNLSISAASGTYSTNDLVKLGDWAKAARYVYSTPFADDPAIPGMSNVLNILSQGGSGLTSKTTNGQAIVPVLALHALLVAAKSIKGTITGSSVIQAMNTVQNVNMWGIVPNWTPSKLISGGTTFGTIFANVSNPMLWDEGFNGTHGTDQGQFNIMKDLPGDSGAPN
jgi:ABC-type branched-subunit amino acid transport system substrate-binding protein